MLLKLERKILKYISKRSSENTFNITEFPKYSGTQIYASLKSLKEKGYLNLADASIDLSNFSYILTAKGHFYKEQRFKEFLSYVIIPILVSIITTLLTMFISA